MRTVRLCAIVTLGLVLGYAFSEASEEKKEGQKPKCCQKAEKEGKKCEQPCCAEAAKEGKNCEKCGGKN